MLESLIMLQLINSITKLLHLLAKNHQICNNTRTKQTTYQVTRPNNGETNRKISISTSLQDHVSMMWHILCEMNQADSGVSTSLNYLHCIAGTCSFHPSGWRCQPLPFGGLCRWIQCILCTCLWTSRHCPADIWPGIQPIPERPELLLIRCDLGGAWSHRCAAMFTRLIQ